MNFKTTIVLLIALVAVGAFFAVDHFRGKSTDTSTQATGKLIDVDAANVKQVSITQPDGKRIVLDKSGTTWRLSEPVNAPADSSAADGLVREITGLQSKGQLGADQKNSVGLDHPNYVIQVTTNDGKTTKLAVGDKSEISNAMYVLVNDGGAPQVVSSSSYDQLSKPADTYRSKKLVEATSDQIQQVAITRDGQTLKLQKQGADWRITEPKEMPADSGEVSSMLFSLGDLRAEEFVNNPGKLEAYGLAKPLTTVWFSTAGPSTQPATAPASQPSGTTVAFGRFDSVLQKNVYASVNGGPVVTVPTTSENAFNKTALDLRDRKVVDIDPAQVESFTVSVNRPAATQPTTRPAEQHEYTLARRQEKAALGPVLPATEPASSQPSSQPSTQPAVAASQPVLSKWVFQSGASGDANDAVVDALLSSLHPLRAEKYLDKAAPATQPVDNYTITLHVGPANGRGPADYTLKFTAPSPTGPAQGTFNDLTFETDRLILEKFDTDFKTPKTPTAPAMPNMQGMPPGLQGMLNGRQ